MFLFICTITIACYMWVVKFSKGYQLTISNLYYVSQFAMKTCCFDDGRCLF